MTASTLALILVSVSLSALAQICFKFGVAASAVSGGGVVAHLVHSIRTPGIMAGLAVYGFGTRGLPGLGRRKCLRPIPSSASASC